MVDNNNENRESICVKVCVCDTKSHDVDPTYFSHSQQFRRIEKFLASFEHFQLINSKVIKRDWIAAAVVAYSHLFKIITK